MEKTNTFFTEAASNQNGIEGGNEMNNQMLTFNSNLSQLDPAVQTKALEQAPELGKTCRDFIASSKEVVNKGLSSNETSVARTYDIIEKNSDAIRKSLNEGGLSEQGKIRMAEILNASTETTIKLNEANQAFIGKETSKYIVGGLTASGLVLGLLSVGLTVFLKTPVRLK